MAPEMQPYIGLTVLFYEGDAEIRSKQLGSVAQSAGTNGTRVHPAIVTRVWSKTRVNLKILFDMQPIADRERVELLSDLEEYVDRNMHCEDSVWGFHSRFPAYPKGAD